ncbi:MAG: hypothetical protein ACLPYW_13090 [Acidimicrobiales bacterium]
MPPDTPDSSTSDEADVEDDGDVEAGSDFDLEADVDLEGDTDLEGDGASDADVGGDAEPDSHDEPFRPPGFLDALKTVFRPNGPRAKAQPATGTDADAQAVNFIDRRERLIASFLAGFQILLGVVVYFEYKRYLVRPSTKKPIVSIAQAHLDTLNYHHQAPELLAINAVLGLFIFAGVLSKRRALVGFTILLGGLGMNASGGGVIGLLYLGIGIWLVFRAMRRTPSARAAAAARAGGSTSSGTSRAGRGSAKSAAASASATAVRKPPPPSKRYTPPSSRRPSPPKPALKAEPEKESRLTSWLRR